MLALLASELKTMPNSLLIEGHTDATPYSSDNSYSNWDLSADRANSARRLMQQNGVRDNQVTQVRGYADQMLRVKNNPADPSNRRVSILVKNDTEAAPEFSAQKIVNGTTPLPGSANDPKSKGPEAKPAGEATSSRGAAGKPSAGGKPSGEPNLLASAAPQSAQPPTEAGTKTATLPAASNKPSPATPAAKPGLVDRFKAMLPGSKKK